MQYQNSAEYDSSIFYFNTVLESNTYSDSIRMLALINRGKTYQLLHQYDLALIDFNKGLKLYQFKKDFNGLAFTHISKGEFYRHLGRFDEATTELNKANQIIKTHPVTPKTQAVYYNRKAAVIAEVDSETDEAVITNSNKAIEISQKYGFKKIEASSYNQLGFLYYNNDDKNAINYYKKALKIYEDLGDIRAQINVIVNMSRYYHGQKQYKKGLKIVNKAIDLIKDKDWYDNLKDLYLLKMNYLYLLGRYKEAYQVTHDRNDANLESLKIHHNKSLEELETKYKVKEKDEQIQLEQEKAKRLQLEKVQKESEVKTYIIISILLFSILSISLYAYYRINKSNKQLKQSVNQKEILLQEVHHRVKNNLTVLNSLLYLQSNKVDNPETKRILNECRTRIHSMALVHQNLYDVNDASKVDLKGFIKQLIQESKDIFGLEKIEITSEINTNNIQFDMSFTVFLGLILNELITNSFKYAFEENTNNSLSITLYKKGNNYELSYSDSGKGLPNNFNIKENTGFGFKLINIMVNQISGTLNYSKKINTFIISFTKT